MARISTGSGGDQGPVRISEHGLLNATGRDDQATPNPVATAPGTNPIRDVSGLKIHDLC